MIYERRYINQFRVFIAIFLIINGIAIIYFNGLLISIILGVFFGLSLGAYPFAGASLIRDPKFHVRAFGTHALMIPLTVTSNYKIVGKLDSLCKNYGIKNYDYRLVMPRKKKCRRSNAENIYIEILFIRKSDAMAFKVLM